MRIPNDDPAKVRRCNEDNYCDEITSDFRARARTLKGKLGRNGTFKRPTAFCKFNVHAADPMSGPRIRKLLVSFSAAFRPSLKSDCLPVLPFFAMPSQARQTTFHSRSFPAQCPPSTVAQRGPLVYTDHVVKFYYRAHVNAFVAAALE